MVYIELREFPLVDAHLLLLLHLYHSLLDLVPREIIQLIVGYLERCVEEHFDLPELRQVVQNFEELQNKKERRDYKKAPIPWRYQREAFAEIAAHYRVTYMTGVVRIPLAESTTGQFIDEETSIEAFQSQSIRTRTACRNRRS